MSKALRTKLDDNPKIRAALIARINAAMEKAPVALLLPIASGLEEFVLEARAIDAGKAGK